MCAIKNSRKEKDYMEDVTYKIIGCINKVHSTLGPGLLESIYEKALMIELAKEGFNVRSQVPIDIAYEGEPLGLGFRIDILVDESIILELKSIERILPVHKKQLLTYLHIADKRIGLLVNFNVVRMKDGIERVVNGY